MAGLHSSVIRYKNNAIAAILNDPEIVAALEPETDSIEDLIERNIFPYFRVPGTDTETLTYITVCIDLPEEYHPQNLMRDLILKICIIVHQDEMHTDFGATRLDYIAAQLDDIFLDNPEYGYGRLRLLSSIESSLDQFHRYREIMYVTNESQVKC